MEITLGEIVNELSLNVKGYFPENMVVSGIGSLEGAGGNQLSFIVSPKFIKNLEKTRACAVIMDYESLKELLPEKPGYVIIDAKNPYLSFAKATRFFYDKEIEHEGKSVKNYSDLAHVDETAKPGKGCILYPGVFIGPGTTTGENCNILSNTYIGKNVKIGNSVLIYANVTIYDGSIIGNNCIIHAGTVVGSDGFGYARDKNGYAKIIHRGIAILEDDVELGANVTVDRGAVDFTRIGKGTKIDNLVQVAHNVIIGENCVIASQTGIAGSSKIGNNAVIGGQVGISGHITIGNNVTIAAKSGVHGDVKDGEIIAGTPAFDLKEWRSAAIRFKKLPELFKRVRSIEERFK